VVRPAGVHREFAGVYEGVPDTPYREDAHLRQLPIDPIPTAKNAAKLLAMVTQSAGPGGGAGRLL
jgi:hypothetical protein